METKTPDTERCVLLPCPFCKSEDIDAGFALGMSKDNIETVSAGCMSCGACGPECFNEDAAAKAWNCAPRAAPTARNPLEGLSDDLPDSEENSAALATKGYTILRESHEMWMRLHKRMPTTHTPERKEGG